MRKEARSIALCRANNGEREEGEDEERTRRRERTRTRKRRRGRGRRREDEQEEEDGKMREEEDTMIALCRANNDALRAMVAVFRHGDRTPKQKVPESSSRSLQVLCVLGEMGDWKLSDSGTAQVDLVQGSSSS